MEGGKGQRVDSGYIQRDYNPSSIARSSGVRQTAGVGLQDTSRTILTIWTNVRGLGGRVLRWWMSTVLGDTQSFSEAVGGPDATWPRYRIGMTL